MHGRVAGGLVSHLHSAGTATLVKPATAVVVKRYFGTYTGSGGDVSATADIRPVSVGDVLHTDTDNGILDPPQYPATAPRWYHLHELVGQDT